MCGIVGITKGKSADSLARTLETIGHRGPDGSGLWQDDHCSLGHARLSIIDLQGGAQPMHDAQGQWHIVFNGEIYNHRQLRQTLGENAFRTQSDTEAILNLARTQSCARQWARQLDGMFAFAIAHGEDLILARDPLGIKPLYIGRQDGAMVFASEIKALPRAQKITEFPAGHVYSRTQGMKRYYQLRTGGKDIHDKQSAQDGIRRRLEEAVRKRLVADVPVGVFLSGGLDSSLIAALAARHKHPLDTFSVGTSDSEDRARALEVAAILGTRHRERVYTIEEAIRILPEVIYHLESFDAALVRSAIPNFFLAKLASEHVKVALSGEGADELFAGYEYLKQLSLPAMETELQYITNCLHNTNLQRCDRMSMAHGLEVRVPFLDVGVVDHAFRIPAELKQRGTKRVEKWVLREMAGSLLPPGVAWRRKEKFAVGAGLGNHLALLAEREISDAEFHRERCIAGDAIARCKEELFYYRIFKQMYPQEELLSLVGRSRSL